MYILTQIPGTVLGDNCSFKQVKLLKNPISILSQIPGTVLWVGDKC